jgi:hypothetical protein
MAVIPLRSYCANCGAEELLSRIAEEAGACPFCQLIFCEVPMETSRGDVSYRLLIGSPRHLERAKEVAR